MKIERFFLINLITVMCVVFSCKSEDKEKTIINKNKLAGTWRLIEYTDFDTVNKKMDFPLWRTSEGIFHLHQQRHC